LEVADSYEVDRLLEHGTGRLIQRPEFSKGAELYEIVRELHRRGLTFSRSGGHIQGERELEMFRLRTVVGLSLDEIAQRFNVSRGRVDQLLRLHFRLDGVPPAAKAHRPPRSLSAKSRRVGYCHQSHFARAFQRRYGVSPSAFRAKSCRTGPPNGTQGQLIPIRQRDEEYDSCVGRVHPRLSEL
jgi:AraC-like DNA-binding protein